LGGGIALTSILAFGYMSLALIIAAFFRSQFKFLQTLFIPSSIIAGLLLLLLGPGIIGVINLPVGAYAENMVFHMLAIIFIILGLRGFKKSDRGGVAAGTIMITKVMAFQFFIGIIFTIIVVLLINPQFFSGFSSLLMLGSGFDSVLARYFGGFWQEELSFQSGTFIAYSFAVLGIIFAYVLGIVMVNIARMRGQLPAFPADDNVSVLTGIVPEKEDKKEAGKLTTDGQSIETFTLHLAVVGGVLLLTYGLMRVVAQWLITAFDPGVVIVGEVFMHFNYLLGFLFALGVRKLMDFFVIDHVLDEKVLNRILGVVVDFMVVAAIVSIPLIISTVNIWAILILATVGAVLTMLAVMWLSRAVFKNESVERDVALFGFLSGNISSSIALLRIVDPELKHPAVREITFASFLSFLAAIPLLFLINLPLIGEEVIYLLYSLGLAAAYIVILFLVWIFFFRRWYLQPPAPTPKGGADRGRALQGSRQVGVEK
jgi:ESS family glutamate:Na+ symporter